MRGRGRLRLQQSGGPRATFACKEPVTEDLFELADLLREWRLGEMQTERGAAEVQLLGDGDEVAQVAEFDFLIHI